MKKNTKFWHIAVIVAFVVSGIFNAIGAISDLFGFAEGISGHVGTIQSIFAFLASRWRWTIGITVLLLAAILFFRWKRIKELEKIETRKLSWFDADRRITMYTGGMDNLIQLKKFLQPRDDVFSWWAVTGVAGMGKTRLAIETLRLDEFRNADVKWLKNYEDYREEKLKGLVDSILESGNFRNILIADDAQIYMDNVGKLIEYIYRKNAGEIGDHKIRLLLLLRMGEDEDLRDRYKQLSSKTAQSTLRATQFSMFDRELKIEKYIEADVTEIVKSYALVTAKKRDNRVIPEDELSEIQKKAVNTLKSDKVDSNHMRPLFAMFITDALLAGQEPMSWNRKDILEYAVGKREEELLMWETQDIVVGLSGRVYDKIKGVVSLSIIRDGIEISELEGIRDDLEEELNLAGISLRDFLKEIQMLDRDGVIRVHMPDILAEYYVLRTLVIEPEDGDEVIEWVISRMVSNMDGVAEFREKVRQDFRYIYNDKLNKNETIGDKLDDFYYAFFKKCSDDQVLDIVITFLAQLNLRDSNSIILHSAIQKLISKDKEVTTVASLLEQVTNCEESGIEEKRLCLDELRQIAELNAGKPKIVLAYCMGLVNVLIFAPSLEEKRSCLSKLKQYAELNAENSEIALCYCEGLFQMRNYSPNLKEKSLCLTELKQYADANVGNVGIVNAYCRGLVNMLYDVKDLNMKRSYLMELKKYAEINVESELMYCKGLVNMVNKYTPDPKERQSYLMELKRFADANAENVEIALRYLEGLVNMTIHAPDLKEKRSCLTELKQYAELNAGNAEIVLNYCRGLVNMLSREQNMEEKRACLNELRRIAGQNVEKLEIVLRYFIGLNIIRKEDKEFYEDYTAEIDRLISDKKFALFISKVTEINYIHKKGTPW